MEKIGLQSVFETSDFQKGLDSYLKGIKSAEGQTQRTAVNIGNSIANAAGNMIRTAAIIGVGALVGLTAALYSTIGPASDLQETTSKATVVFGEFADEVMAMGETSAAALGMSANAAIGAAATYGNLFRAMGISEEASADMSTNLVQLAADLASFNNMDPTVVLDSLRAGLSGETEPLKKLGVNLTAATIEAKAMELGFKKVKGELTAAAKAQASYALIMEQTSLAQGDFERTSDGVANQQRITAATIENLKAKIGTGLLPVVQLVMGMFNKFASSEGFTTFLNNIIAGITAFATKMQLVIGLFAAGNAWSALTQLFGKELGTSIWNIYNILVQVAAWLQANWVPIVAGLVVVLVGLLIPAFVAWATAAWAAASATIAALAPILIPILAIGAAVALLVAAWQNNWGGIRDTLTSVWEGTIKPALEQLWAWLSVNVPAAIATLVGFWNSTLLPALQAVWAWVQENLIPLFEALGELLVVVVGYAVQELARFWSDTLYPALQDVGAFLGETLMPLWEDLLPVLEDVGSFLSGVLKGAFDGITSAIQWVIEKVQKLIDFFKKLKDATPPAFTPGSPTPFEVGMLGIADAVNKVATAALPKLSAELSAMQPTAAQGFARATSQQVSNVYNINTGGNTISNGMDAATFEARVRQIITEMV